MALQFQRGTAAIEEAAKNTGKKFSPFTPQISWKAEDEKYIGFLTDIEEAATILLHEWINCGEKEFGEGANKKTFTDFGFFISRKDPAIGEDSDPLTEKGSTPKKRILVAAVELEPIMNKNSHGRSRPQGFTVKTQEYTKKTDDGDETVTAPVIGIITQASKNFFKLLVSHAESEGPIQDTAFKVKRIGGDSETAYSFTPYFDQEIDYSDLLANIDGVSYLTSDEETWDEIERVVDFDLASESSMEIGGILLNKRLNELADLELYNEKTNHIETIEDKYAKKDNKEEKADRPQRRSQRDNGSGSENEKSPAVAKSDRFAEIKKLAEEKKKQREAKS